MRWLVRFGYDGLPFYGWARQPGLRTVEGEILGHLVRQGVTDSARSARLAVASRTDRGVSARANALTLTSDRSGTVLLRGLNGIAPEIFFTAAAPVPETFRVRGAERRIYRYYEPADADTAKRWRELSHWFEGEVDVRSFGRGQRSADPVLRTVESVHVEELPGGMTVELRAPSFVWGMVRKIIGALRECSRGRLSEARLRAALAGRDRLTLPLAEPERLLLWDVEYPIPWTVTWAGPNRHQSSHIATTAASAWSRRNVMDGWASVGAESLPR